MEYGQIVREDSLEERKEELVDLVGTRNADSENSENDRVNPLRKRKCLAVMCLVVVGITLCFGTLFLLNNQDLDSENELSAKIVGCYNCYKHDLAKSGGIIHRPNNCADTEFGCCEVYGDCSVSEDSFESKAYQLRRKFKLDKEGSNCPTLGEIVNLYKKNNDKGECHDPSTSYNEHGCCSVLTTCDKVIKNNETFTNQTLNNQEDRLLREDINLYIQKKDINGSNCPTIREIVTYYDTYYNVNHLLFGIGFILLVFGLLSL